MSDYKGTREAFAAAMMDLAAQDERVVLVSSDSLKAMRATTFAATYPKRVFEVGISEQNAVAVAAGLASAGLIPYVGTYAGFITLRACEQLRTFVAYPGLKVRFVGANGGIFAGEREGVTHQFFEDIGIVRTIPGITVVVPSDAGQTYHATKAIVDVDGPVYLRIGSGREHELHDRSLPFELGKARILAEYGDDVAMIVCGFLAGRALQAAESLQAAGINATVVEMSTLKPLDGDMLEAVLARTGCAVTIEDHNVIGGLGSAVAEWCGDNLPTPIERVGLQDIFPSSGEAEAVLDAYGMSVIDMALAARRAVGRKNN